MTTLALIGPGLYVRHGKPLRREVIERRVSEMLHPRVGPNETTREVWNAERQCWEVRVISMPEAPNA